MNVVSLSENLFFCTVRIEAESPTGTKSSGTGFLYAHRLGIDRNVPFIVTNKHVVIGMKVVAVTFLQKNGEEPHLGNGSRIEIQSSNDAWFGHPDPSVDIAICPFSPLEQLVKVQHNKELFYRFITQDYLPSEEQLQSLDAIETVTFVGYPNGLWDKVNLLPIARRGSTATPVTIDFEGSPKFLIDASVFGGSSGSPVFIVNQGMYTNKFGGTTVGSRLLFLGVIAAVYFRESHTDLVEKLVPTALVQMSKHQEMIDLGIVFKARTVIETIEALFKVRQALGVAN